MQKVRINTLLLILFVMSIFCFIALAANFNHAWAEEGHGGHEAETHDAVKHEEAHGDGGTTHGGAKQEESHLGGHEETVHGVAKHGESHDGGSEGGGSEGGGSEGGGGHGSGSEGGGSDEGGGGHGGGEGGGSEGGGGGHGPPVLYYLYWMLLAVPLFFAGKFLITHFSQPAVAHAGHGADSHGHDTHHEEPAAWMDLSKILIGSAALLYIFEQFLTGYHEPAFAGFVRFLLKATAGIMLTFYAFTQMHEHH